LLQEIVSHEVPPSVDESLYLFKALPLLEQKPPFYMERNFKHAIQNLRTEYANAFEQVGRLLAQSDPEKAKNYYYKMQQVGPTTNGSITQLLAIFLATSAQWQEASYWFDEALALSPNDSIIKQNIATFRNEWAKSATNSAVAAKAQERSFKNGTSINLPSDWIIVRDTKELTLLEKGEIKAEIRRSFIDQMPLDYLKTNTLSLGVKINEGTAQIPGSDYSYLRIFKKDNTFIWQFMLFKKATVFDIRLFTTNEASVKEIDPILVSIE
jgi:hypothetical protein